MIGKKGMTEHGILMITSIIAYYDRKKKQKYIQETV
jgi:hypothetical protein